MSIPSFTPSETYARFSTLVYPTVTPVTASMGNAAATLTAAQVLKGLLLIDPDGGSQNLTLPTAALLVAAVNGAAPYTSFDVTIINTANASETITVVAGTGGTIVGTATIAQSNNKTFKIVFTNVTSGSEAYSAYSLGTVTT